MQTIKITLEVDTDLAEAYREASSQDRSKLQLLLNLWLREMSTHPTSLKTLMDELSDKAQERGLTTDRLERMLDA